MYKVSERGSRSRVEIFKMQLDEISLDLWFGRTAKTTLFLMMRWLAEIRGENLETVHTCVEGETHTSCFRVNFRLDWSATEV